MIDNCDKPPSRKLWRIQTSIAFFLTKRDDASATSTTSTANMPSTNSSSNATTTTKQVQRHNGNISDNITESVVVAVQMRIQIQWLIWITILDTGIVVTFSLLFQTSIKTSSLIVDRFDQITTKFERQPKSSPDNHVISRKDGTARITGLKILYLKILFTVFHAVCFLRILKMLGNRSRAKGWQISVMRLKHFGKHVKNEGHLFACDRWKEYRSNNVPGSNISSQL